MNIVLTGSLGHISQPLAALLLDKKHSVTIISSKEDKKKPIEAIGAKAAIGSLQNKDFLSATFAGADIAYCMEPPMDFRDLNLDPEHYWINIAHAYATAIRQSGVKKIVHLSSIGAHTDKGVGMLATHYQVENILRELPHDVSIKFMRPVGFYYNMFAFIPMIKMQGSIIQNYGGDLREPWVSPLDIADVIAEEMEKPFTGRTVRYIASDEVTPSEVAEMLGAAIGKPGLAWKVIPDDQFEQGLLAAGFHPKAAKGYTGMNAGRRANLYDDYLLHRPQLGRVKLHQFALDFAKAYQAS